MRFSFNFDSFRYFPLFALLVLASLSEATFAGRKGTKFKDQINLKQECKAVLKENGYYLFPGKRKALCRKAAHLDGINALKVVLPTRIKLNDLILEELLKIQSSEGTECIHHFLDKSKNKLQASQIAVCNHIRNSLDLIKLSPFFEISHWHNADDIQIILGMDNPLHINCLSHLSQAKTSKGRPSPSLCSQVTNTDALDLLNELNKIETITPSILELSKLLETSNQLAKDCLFLVINNNSKLFGLKSIRSCQKITNSWALVALETLTQNLKIEHKSQLKKLLSTSSAEATQCLIYLQKLGLDLFSNDFISHCQKQTPESLASMKQNIDSLPPFPSIQQRIRAVNDSKFKCFAHWQNQTARDLESLGTLLQRSPHQDESHCYDAMLDSLANSNSVLVRSKAPQLSKQIQFAKSLFERHSYFIESAKYKKDLRLWQFETAIAHGGFHAEYVKELDPSEQLSMQERLNRIHNTLVFSYLLAFRNQSLDSFFNDAFDLSRYCIDGRTEYTMNYLMKQAFSDSDPFYGISNRTQLIHKILQWYQQEVIENQTTMTLEGVIHFVTQFVGQPFHGITLEKDLISDTIEASIEMDLI
jgi:hypothetical protein